MEAFVFKNKIEVDEEVEKMLNIVKNVQALFLENNIQAWFNGTFGVAGYAGYFFDKPVDVDCGVLEKDFMKANKLLLKNGFQKTNEKDNDKFKVCAYLKNSVIFEIGTFDKNLGNNKCVVGGVKYNIPDAKWLAECYNIVAEKSEGAKKRA